MFTVEDGLPNNSIRAITEDKQGNIWIGTAAGTVYYSLIINNEVYNRVIKIENHTRLEVRNKTVEIIICT